jgi:putative hemolysin
MGILIALILCNGLFAASEIAIISVNQNRLRKNAENGDKRARLLRKMTEELSSVLAAIQIGISIIALFSGAYAATSFSGGLTSLFIRMGIPLSQTALSSISVLIITLLLAYFNLVFGELVPKRIAMKKADTLAMAVAPTVHYLSSLTKPVVKILSASTNFFSKMVGVDVNQSDDDVTEEEIRLMVDAGGDTGAIDESEMEMINNVFEFDDKTADDICTHRTDIVALPVDAGTDELTEVLEIEKFSRIPVYEDNMDNIIGILHIKDLIKYIIHNKLHEVDLRQIIRKPYFVPFSVKTDELFEYMQKNKVHVAIVLDEYGGTLGLITMEDLIEEVMGNIFDEYDEEEKPDIIPLDENTFTVSGGADLQEVSDYFGVVLPTDDYNTLGGFIISLLGRIPAEEEQPEIEFNGLLLKVNKVEEKRISEVFVCKVE